MSKSKIGMNELMGILFPPFPNVEIKPEESALLLMNFLEYKPFFLRKIAEKGILEPEANGVLNDFEVRAQRAAENAGKILKVCREKSFEIVHVRTELSSEKTEGSERLQQKPGFIMPTSTESQPLPFYQAVQPRKGELVFSQPSYDVFTNTRLDFVLRNMHVNSLIICGLTADQSVLINTILAATRGYHVIVVSDACATLTRETQGIFINWFKTQVNVATTETLLSQI